MVSSMSEFIELVTYHLTKRHVPLSIDDQPQDRRAEVASRCIKAREAGPPPHENRATRVKRKKICQRSSIPVLHLMGLTAGTARVDSLPV